MRAVFKRELRSYFVTPVGWAYLFVFTLLAGLTFAFINVKGNESIGVRLFLGSFRLPALLVSPILTMRLLAEERKNKADQLLVTSPLPIRSFVLGKFFAAALVLLIGLASTLLFFLLVSPYGEIDAGALLSNYVGFYLMNAATLALGVLASALCENQASAGLLTLGVNLLLYLGENYALPLLSASYLQPLYRALSAFALGARFETFANGVISLSSVLYFVTVTFSALFLTDRVIEGRRWSK